MYHPFSIAETLSTAWGILKSNFVTIIVYSVVTFFILLILGIILGILFTSDNYYIDMLVSLITVIFQAYTTLGLYKLIFTLIDSEFYEFDISQVLPRFTNLISFLPIWFLFITLYVSYKFFIDSLTRFPIVYDISIIGGVLVLLYVILRCMFFLAFIVDDDSGPFESVKQSLALTKGNFLNVFAILAIILLLIGLPAILSRYFILAPVMLPQVGLQPPGCR
jgi:hypothetical protein